MSATVTCPDCNEENAYHNGRYFECPDCAYEWDERHTVASALEHELKEYERLIKLTKPYFQLEHGKLYECTVQHHKGIESTTIIPLAIEDGRNRLFILTGARELQTEYPQIVREIIEMDFDTIMCDGLIDYPREFEVMTAVVTTERHETYLDAMGMTYDAFESITEF